MQDLTSGPGPKSQGWRRGYIPTGQRRALRGFWILLGAIVAVDLVLLVIREAN